MRLLLQCSKLALPATIEWAELYNSMANNTEEEGYKGQKCTYIDNRLVKISRFWCVAVWVPGLWGYFQTTDSWLMIMAMSGSLLFFRNVSGACTVHQVPSDHRRCLSNTFLQRNWKQNRGVWHHWSGIFSLTIVDNALGTHNKITATLVKSGVNAPKPKCRHFNILLSATNRPPGVFPASFWLLLPYYESFSTSVLTPKSNITYGAVMSERYTAHSLMMEYINVKFILFLLTNIDVTPSSEVQNEPELSLWSGHAQTAFNLIKSTSPN